MIYEESTCEEIIDSMGGDLGVIMVHFHDVARRMKKWEGKDIRDTHFDVGEMAFLRIIRDQF